MQRLLRAVPLLSLSLLAACELGYSRNIVDNTAVASVSAVANTHSLGAMFVGDASGQIAEVDPANGQLRGSLEVWSAVSAMTGDAQRDDRVWALHVDGFLVNWASGPQITGFYQGPDAAEYCDIDHAADGDLYVTTLQSNGDSKLWRRDAANGAWQGVVLPGGEGGCDRVSHDLLGDRLFVLRDGYDLERRDPNTLSFVSSASLAGGQATDLDVLGDVVVAAGETAAPSGNPPGGGPPVPSFRMAWTFRPLSGYMLDSKIISGALATSVQMTVNPNSSSGEMLVSSGAGTFTVRGVRLIDP